jgi:hypothetical protein
MEEWMLRCRTIDLRSSFTARFASAFADFREPVLVRPLLVAAEARPAVRRGMVAFSTSIFRPYSPLHDDLLLANISHLDAPREAHCLTAAGTGRGLTIVDRTTFCAG